MRGFTEFHVVVFNVPLHDLNIFICVDYQIPSYAACRRNLDPIVVARLTELGRNLYGAAFRSHSGRWEPLPGSGPLDEMAQIVVTLLEPYLQPDNY